MKRNALHLERKVEKVEIYILLFALQVTQSPCLILQVVDLGRFRVWDIAGEVTEVFMFWGKMKVSSWEKNTVV